MATFGLLVGISLLLQGMNQFILSGVGYDDLSSGEGNTLYQLLAALVGVGLGSRVTCEADLRTVLRALHVAMAVGVVGFGVLCAAVGSEGVFSGSIVLMLGVMSLLGATLMGLLPFVLQQAVCECSALPMRTVLSSQTPSLTHCSLAARSDTVAPVSENVVSGLIYIVAMVVAASLTQVTSMISAMWSVAIVVGLLVLELGLFAGCVARAWSPPTVADQAGLLVSPRQRGSVS